MIAASPSSLALVYNGEWTWNRSLETFESGDPEIGTLEGPWTADHEMYQKPNPDVNQEEKIPDAHGVTAVEQG